MEKELTHAWWFDYTTHLDKVRGAAHARFREAHPSEQANPESVASKQIAESERQYEDDLLRAWEKYRAQMDARSEKYVVPREVERITEKRR